MILKLSTTVNTKRLLQKLLKVWVAVLCFITIIRLEAVPAHKFTYKSDIIIAKADALELYNHDYWHRLIHYKPRWFGGVKSESDGPLFFLSEKGKHNPRAEMLATIQGFYNGDPLHPKEMHPQCRFPERLRWLNTHLSFINDLPNVDCSRFTNWKKESNVGGAQMVFASYYPNNPASLFGHTFLKLVRKNSDPNNDLLNHGVNYAANPTTANPLFYAILGLSGGFPGTYTMFPYYLKVNEYADMESRDLWEYDLKLSEEQTERLVNHLWELGSTHFDYFYFDENCSYQLLTLLEVAIPNVSLSERFIYVVQPIDTVKVLRDHSTILGEANYRPSQVNRFLLSYRNLTSDEKKELRNIISEQRLPDSLTEINPANEFSKEQTANILEAALEYYSWKKGREIEGKEAEHKNKLLSARAKLGKQPTFQPAKYMPPEKPIEGHETSQFKFLGGMYNNSAFFDLTWRPAMRELIDSPYAYSPHLQMIMMGFNGRVYKEPDESARFIFDRLDVISIYSLQPLQEMVYQPSWSVQIGAENLSMESADGSINGRTSVYAQAGLGPSVSLPFFNELVLFSLVQLRLETSNSFAYDWRLAPVSTTGFLWRFSKGIAWQTQLDYRHFVITPDLPVTSVESKLNININTSFALEGAYRWYPATNNRELLAGLKYYL